MAGLPLGTVTFLFADIEGSTDLTRRLGAEFGDVRAALRRILREALDAHDGHEIDTEGDGFFAAFDRASDAVGAAVAAQRALAAASSHGDERVAVRMGLHTAEPYLHEDGYIGVGVSRAARICAAGHGGQILLSHATAGVVEDLELPGITLRELGRYRLKDIAHPQRLVQVDVDGLATEFAPLKAGATARAVATLLQTDLRGWSGILRTLGDDAAATAGIAYHRIVTGVVREHGGSTLETIADNTLSIFADARNAVVAAIAVRDALRDGDWIAPEIRPALSAAVHTGRVADPDAGHLGTPALRALRLCAAAEPWQVLVSHATHAMLEGQAIHPVELRDLGERDLPGGDGPTRVFEAVTATAG